MIHTDSCAEMTPLVVPYAEDALSSAQAHRMDVHLRVCPACRMRLERFRAVRGCLRGTVGPEAMDARFHEETGRRLREVSTGPLAKIPHEEPEAPQPAPAGFLDSLAGRFGAAPWWMISGAFHALLLLLVALIGMAVMRSAGKDTVILTSLEKKLDPPEEEKPKERDILKNPVPVELPQAQTVENPVVMHEEVEIAEHNETANDADANNAFGDEGISDLPLGGSGFSGAIGVGGGGAGAFGRPGNAGGRLRRAMAGGGGKATESSVDAGLEWLARNQEADGRWAIQRHGGSFPESCDTGVTGLALLAFLGAGHTEKVGKYKDTVRKATEWLMAHQAADGSIGLNTSWGGYKDGSGYCNAIGGLALAEAYGMGRNAKVKEAAQKSLDYSVNEHWNEEYGGWRYGKPKKGWNGGGGGPVDVSMTGWYIMQLKSAKVAGLKVDHAKYFVKVEQFLAKIRPDAKTADGYADHRYGYSLSWTTPSTGNTAIGLVCQLFMGTDPHELASGADWVLAEDPPKWGRGSGRNSAAKGSCPHYHWYYGTLSMFQIGGEKWQKWNEALKETLLPNQRKDGEFNGSWDGLGSDGETAGRAYSTAMAVLCLEVYYRYLPLYR